MTLLCPNVGEVTLLSYMLDKTEAGHPVMHLYNNNYTPVETSTLGHFTQCTESLYAAATLTSSSWTIATDGDTTTASYPETTFTFGTAANVYGYYVTSTGGDLLWAEAFSGVFTLPAAGGSIAITPKISLG
jgi:hypothetical protein